MQTGKSYKLKPLQTKEEFLRDLFVKFARDENVAPDLFEAECYKVEEYEKQFICVSANTHVSYSCSVGYDREETYVEMETKQELVGSKRVKVTKPVNKTRKLTDWQVYSGERSDNAFSVVKPDGTIDKECLICEEIIKTGKMEKMDVVLEVHDDVLAKAKSYIESQAVIQAEFNLPGDRSKDFSSTSSVTVTETECYVVPFYKVTYTYKGKLYLVEHNACTDFSITLSEEEEEKLAYNPVDTEKIANKKAEPFWIAALVSGGLFLASFLLMFFIDFMTIFLVSIIPAIIFFVIYSKKCNKYKSELDEIEQKKKENILTEKRKIVYSALCKALERNNLKTITYEEVYGE